jgi:hypothetical protein
MKDKLKAILESVDPKQEIFTDEMQESLISQLDEKINEKVEAARTELMEKHADKLEELNTEHTKVLEEKLTEQDTDHASKLEKLLEDIDTDHSQKLEMVLEKKDAQHTEELEKLKEDIDTEHTEKLEKVLEHLDTDATTKLTQVKEFYESTYEDDIINSLSDFLDTYIEKHQPEAVVVESTKLDRLEKMFESMKELLVVNDEYVHTEIKEALEDGKSQLDEKDAKIDELMMEKIKLNKKIKKFEADKLLGEKTKNMDEIEKSYILTQFAESSVEEIENQIDKGIQVDVPKDDVPSDEVLQEAIIDNNAEAQQMNNYVDMITKSQQR